MGIEELSNPIGRPDDPKFWQLSDAVLRADGYVEDGSTPDEIDDLLLKFFVEELGIDIDTVMYVAMQRVSRKYGVKTLADLTEHVMEIRKEIPIWLDGFTSGATWKQMYP